jgi:hypothetical protein
MFKSVYIRFRNIYNSISKLYVSIIVHHPFATIVCYLLLITSFSLGLFQIEFDRDNERLTELRVSKFRAHKQTLDERFKVNLEERFFQYKLTNLGYYIEFIITLRNSSKSFCKKNPELLEAYNRFYDGILELKVIDYPSNSVYENSPSISNFEEDPSVYSYENLCAKRMGKCAIEGGLVRQSVFQEDFLKGQISYEKNDPKTLYIDPIAQDGVSIDFTFGRNRTKKCVKQNEGENLKVMCYIKKAYLIRNRFDFLFGTEKQKQLSVKFMHEFVKYMESIEKVNMYSDFNISYHTSHTLQAEIEKFSQLDLKYVALMFFSFWCIFFCLMWFDLNLIKILLSTNSRSLMIFLNKLNWFFINSSGLLIFATVVQYLSTIVASLGLMSLFKVPINQILYTILFVLMSKFDFFLKLSNQVDFYRF